ncbi:enoyl-CoA-hydratase DpgB [Kitasatospora sp. NPDC018619]|uniref:enoyl-CoA-hydratase DpgB n=1 Tax=unclassified Kitasatospora TaxID=2633591 RepID=UPI0037A4D36A
MSVSELLPERTGSTGRHVLVDCSQPLTEQLIGQVVEVCDELEDADRATFAVLHVEGAPGVREQAWPGEVGIHLVNKWERALRRLERAPAAVVAVVAGECAGPALDLLLAADHRIATADTRLSPAVTDGRLWPGMAVHRLVQQLGVARARRLVLFGAEVGAAEGAELGLFDRVVEDRAAVGAVVEDVAARLGGLVGGELAIRRRLLLDATTTSFEESLGAHLAACDRTLRSRSADRA